MSRLKVPSDGGHVSLHSAAKDPQEMERATLRLLKTKQRESQNGHDGTWVAHPALAGFSDVDDKYLMAKSIKWDFQSPEHTINADTT
ncbi:hypothetical protein OK016_29340 [Vibrio chagasii]|nr:hypothetical protein [Vibrio chagasii]